ncbi:MAG: epoxide hydrolase [Mycobacterium sp.]|nr:epoxide hydrolase [Mycobacterium sp.]
MADLPVRPFRIGVPDNELADLRERLNRTRWPNRECATDWSQGMPIDYTRDLAGYWANTYDWRAREARLNAFDQFVTEIDGLDIHFVHQRSANPDALPLLITHGWPGSIVEFAKVIGPLSRDFHLVCPTLPGFGFSGKPTSPGWTVERIALAWDILMKRLGYDRYGAQGGDWGAAVTTQVGRNGSSKVAGCIAIHLNMPIAAPVGDLTELSQDEREALAAQKHYQQWEAGYSKQQATRPQTLGYGLADSPVGQLAWIVEKLYAWSDCDGHPENVFGRDEMLDDVMMYWATNAGASSARLYWESFGAFGGGGKVEVPTGIARFPKEIVKPARRWCEAAYNVTHWTEMPHGGHFAAFEQPDLFIADVREFFLGLR